ncbi:lysyl oxidase [Kribbella sp. VKM Ac-2527]|uniref:Lysyl oxidase n=1 Tax=Kribbella caucasensis TaxID=2512215 RepID=A0A4R6K5P9_9ACTN|nr:lysyl oxidase family protein [Kribbella sp. VKM Ac-2527]TDO44592.1 lysyl oxidase [Kribbella sp. VKM Ac-2527]
MAGAVALVAVAAGAAAATAATQSKPTATQAVDPQLKLVAGSTDITLDRVPEYGVDLDLGTHLVAGKSPVEVRATRKSYNDPVVAYQVVNGKKKALPAGAVMNFAGLSKFLHVTVTDAAAKKVLDRDQSVCLNGDGSRTRPDAPDTSPYPDDCSANPFTVGAVWGLQSYWSANTFAYDAQPADLPVGKYKVKVSVNKLYKTFFKIPAYDSSVALNLTVKDAEDCGGGHGEGCRTAKAGTLEVKTLKAPEAEKSVAFKPNATRPTGKASVPKGPKPDLRSLPAWQITVGPGEEGTPNEKRDFLQFSANVWNAGPSTLVLDGFRRQGEDLMDAYQYFYDEKGKQVGYQKTGTMEWDARDGHTHWHFTDFARYSLLNAKQTEVVRSQKEAFCLAATDSIDYTVKNANWHPQNTDLHTACGNHGSLSVREVLDVGSGDTYIQSLPGQSFDVTDLPNGTYYVEVVANPEKRLFETSTTNNKSLRKIILGGTPHHRTVQVPPVGLIDAP